MQLRRSVVLVVEDDPATCEMLQAVLEQEYTVECASDGAVGLARIAAGGIDLVLLDLTLPEVDGLELCRHVRSCGGEVYLPIIMLTALAGEAQRHAGFAAGADDYLTKPFDIEDLTDRVRVWVQTRHRLKAAHDQLLREQERLRELEQRALRERLSQDEAVLAMARTASHELNQPLTLLVGLLELWEAGCFPAQDTPRLRAELQEATDDLARRVETLSRVVRYETVEIAGRRILDLARAQRSTAC